MLESGLRLQLPTKPFKGLKKRVQRLFRSLQSRSPDPTLLELLNKMNFKGVRKVMTEQPDMVNFPIDGDQNTLLILACARGHLRLVEWLVKRPGIDLDIQNRYGWTALYEATAADRWGIVKLLLLMGADCSLRASCFPHQTALEMATQLGHEDCMALLEGAERMELLKKARRAHGAVKVLSTQAQEDGLLPRVDSTSSELVLEGLSLEPDAEEEDEVTSQAATVLVKKDSSAVFERVLSNCGSEDTMNAAVGTKGVVLEENTELNGSRDNGAPPKPPLRGGTLSNIAGGVLNGASAKTGRDVNVGGSSSSSSLGNKGSSSYCDLDEGQPPLMRHVEQFTLGGASAAALAEPDVMRNSFLSSSSGTRQQPLFGSSTSLSSLTSAHMSSMFGSSPGTDGNDSVELPLWVKMRLEGEKPLPEVVVLSDDEKVTSTLEFVVYSMQHELWQELRKLVV